MSLAIFLVLQVTSSYSGPDPPGGRGFIYFELLGYRPVRCMVLAPTVDHVLYSLDGLAHRLGNRRLDAFSYQAGDQLTNACVIGNRRYHSALVVSLARRLVQDGVSLDKAE